VVFNPPDSPTTDYVKRIVGMPGETIEMKGGQVFINGTVLSEPYILEPARNSFETTVIPVGSYFILGDNRNNSNDSRFFGAVPVANIKFIIQLNN